MRLKYIFGAVYAFCMTVLLFSYQRALCQAPVVGGQYAFEYLRMSNSAHVSALGGISIANPVDDISLAFQNPALMRPGLHNQLQLTYNSFYAGTSIMNLGYGYHVPKLNTSFCFGVQYLNYGTMDRTDPIGNINGTFQAADFAITLGASRTYLERWRYGAAIKWARSGLGDYSSIAAAVDVGINYYDTSRLIDVAITAKNMGVMVTKYTQEVPTEPIPFDLQIGVSKKFKHLPLRLLITAHHLYQWDIRYANPADLQGTNAFGNSDTASDKGSHFVDKLFRHLIFGAEVTFAKRVTFTASYNNLHRRELAISTSTGLAGFAFGLGLNLNKFQVHYGRTYYHIAGPYNELSLTMSLNKLMGLGKTGEKIRWSDFYPDWE